MVKKITRKNKKSTGSEAKSIEDFKTAALIVSVVINVAVFVGWLALKITTEYDDQVAAFLFGR